MLSTVSRTRGVWATSHAHAAAYLATLTPPSLPSAATPSQHVALTYEGTTWVAKEVLRTNMQGRTVREMLFEAGHTPYNAAANIVNCRGMGTCGTCAVEVQVVAGPGLSQQNWKEKARLSCPPHVRVEAKERLRLACQCRVLPGTTVTVSKHPGMWGHKLLPKRGNSRMCAEDSGNTDAGSAGSVGWLFGSVVGLVVGGCRW